MADDHSAMIAEFQSITQESEERSRFFLESANWQLPVALSGFYDSTTGPGDLDAGFSVPPAEVEPPTAMETEPTEASGRPPQRGDSLAKAKPPTGGSSRMRSLADYAKPPADNSDEEEGQEFYAGGSEHSGEVIVGPGKKKSGEDIVKQMFKDAKKHGAQPVEDQSASHKKKDPKYFTGGGYKLGETDTDHEFVPGAAAQDNGERRQLDVVLKLWQDGFSIDDGPLRGYTDPESREFLGAISKGEIPQELLKLAKGGEVNLDMEDHKHEDFKQVKKKMQPFTGEGHTLGCVTPTVVTHQAPPSRPAASSVDPPVLVDDSLPTTTLRVQLGDGSRVTQKFNHSHTVADLYSFVRDRDQGGRTFVLMTTFPNKELKEESSSLKEGNLLNAVIVQRYK